MPDSSATVLDTRQDEIKELVHLRAELRGKITRSRQDLQKLAFEFQRIDTAIRELKGNGAITGNRPQSGPVSDVTRILFEALNEAGRPMTSNELALRIIDEMGLDPKDKAVRKYIVRRVCVCLWEQVQKGHFKKSEPRTWPQKWERVRPAQ